LAHRTCPARRLRLFRRNQPVGRSPACRACSTTPQGGGKAWLFPGGHAAGQGRERRRDRGAWPAARGTGRSGRPDRWIAWRRGACKERRGGRVRITRARDTGARMPITLLDGVLIGFTLVSAVLAMVRGFSREILSVASWAIAAVAAFFLYPLVLPLIT